MFGIVIDKDGYKIDFVVLKNGLPHGYILKDKEQVIEKDWNIANTMNKPKWNFDMLEWEETEPIEEPLPTTKTPTTDELLTQMIIDSL